jgi:hypothetical protein
MAVDAGVTMLDLAPSYGIEHEAEVVAGEALRNRSAAEVMITTKVELADDEPGDLTDRMIKSLEASLGRSGQGTCHPGLLRRDDAGRLPSGHEDGLRVKRFDSRHGDRTTTQRELVDAPGRDAGLRGDWQHPHQKRGNRSGNCKTDVPAHRTSPLSDVSDRT